MRRARPVVVLRLGLAAAIAAITIPFIAHAAAGDESLVTPTAQVFPTRQGVGVTWQPVDASAYRVERKQGTAEWQDASGDLAAAETTWVDSSLEAGASADYRVVAESSTSEVATSAPISAKRAAEDPVVGDVDVLALDANRGAGVTWLQNETAGPVTASAPTGGSRTLSAGAIKLRVPAFLAGPGTYNLTQSQIELTQGDRSCTTTGYLWVTALAYKPDLELETMAATLHVYSCAGTDTTAAIEIRFKSSIGYQALSVAPDHLDAGRVMLGKTSAGLPITVRNIGIESMKIDRVELNWGAPPVWKVESNNCPASLPVAASCTVTVTFEPGLTGPHYATLTISDRSSLGRRQVALSGTGISLPREMDVYVSPTFTGHTVQWQSWPTSGGTAVRGYFLHRYLDGLETTRWVDAAPHRTSLSTTEINPKPGTEYAVSVVNEVGEGPTGTRRPVPRATDQIAIVDGQPTTAELKASDLSGRIVPFPSGSGSVTPNETVASAPDGRVLAYVTNNQERVLWTRRVDPDQLGVPVKLWSSPLPIAHLSWSPDGTRIAFQAPENESDTALPCVFVIPATGGTPEKISCDVANPSWMPDALTLMVVDRRLDGDDRFARIEAKPGGARVSMLPAPARDSASVRVSPGGQLVAFAAGSTVAVADNWSDKVKSSAPLDGDVRSISWDPDGGGQLLALTASGRITNILVGYDGTMTGRAPIILGSSAYGATLDIAWQRLGVTIKPTPAVTGPQVSITFDSSALPSGTRFTCEIQGSGGPAASCVSPVTASGLLSGEHLLLVTATEPSGHMTKAVRTFTVDATGPVSRVVLPAYDASTAASATVQVAASDPSGIGSYDMRYRRASYLSGFGAYVQPWTATTATWVNLSVDPGYEYCVSVRAKDKLGNVGAWSAEKCFARPMDDRALGATAGWSRTSWSAFYLGTATQTTSYGASLTRTVQGKRFYLVATKCPTCGLIAVYAGGKYIGAVNLASATTQRQAVIPLPVQSTLFSGTLTFTVRSATGKFVQIDGLAVRRS